MTTNNKYDVIIIGGSYSGLSAAMSLGRALRNILVIDSGNACNKQTPQSHNFITHDGETPAEISAKAKRQVLEYNTVSFINGKVINASKKENSFDVETEKGEMFHAKKLLFATGVTDIMPDIKGFSECWGISVLHCPYCHGYEFKTETTGILANGDMGFEFCKLIYNWTKNLILFTNGTSTLTKEQHEILTEKNIVIIENDITSIEHKDGYVQHLACKDGTKHKVKALYARPSFKQHCDLPKKLGCELTEQGYLVVDLFQKTTLHGVYAAGDCTTMFRAVSKAVSEGTTAGAMVNKELIEEEF